MTSGKLHQRRLGLSQKARCIELETLTDVDFRPKANDTDGASEVDSDFVAVFGCPPEQLHTKMQRMSVAFIMPDSGEATLNDCLGANFLKHLVKAARGQYGELIERWADPQYVYCSFESCLDLTVPCCYLCGFLRSELFGVHADRDDIEFPRHGEGVRRIIFHSASLKDSAQVDDVLRVYAEPLDKTMPGIFSLAPWIDDREGQHPHPPSRLRFASADPRNEPAQLQIQRWIDECNEHESCDSPRVTLLPTRILDVGSSTSPTLHLHVPKTQEKAHFLTLSYCWGGYEGIKLLECNLDSFERSIDEAMLPPTYADAVFLTRRLGIRYLWIDALCVIQDSSTDWEEQSAMMDQVYGNSYLTICASSSPDPSCGFLKLKEHNSFTHVYCGDLSHGQESYPIFLTQSQQRRVRELHRPQIGALREDPLTSRAWAVQERLLSRRALYFTDAGMMWQCRQATHSESGISASPQLGLSLYDASAGCQLWYWIIETYSHCTLSKPTDRLPAILGYARAFSLANNLNDYLAGHWVIGLFESLFWDADYRYGHNPLHQAPSWSWASMNGGVRFTLSHYGEFTKIAELLEHNATHPREQVGRSYQAKLRIRAPMAAVTIFPKLRGKDGLPWCPVKLKSFPYVSIEVQTFLDYEVSQRTEAVLAILHKRNQRSQDHDLRYCGLVLQKAVMNDLTLRRIGIFHIEKDSSRIKRAFFSRKAITLV